MMINKPCEIIFPTWNWEGGDVPVSLFVSYSCLFFVFLFHLTTAVCFTLLCFQKRLFFLQVGFRLDANNSSCSDIDECANIGKTLQSNSYKI